MDQKEASQFKCNCSEEHPFAFTAGWVVADIFEDVGVQAVAVFSVVDQSGGDYFKECIQMKLVRRMR